MLAEEYAGTGILVNAVAPGPVATPFWMGEGGAAWSADGGAVATIV